MNFWWALLLEFSLWTGGGIYEYDPLETVMFDNPCQITVGGELGLGFASVYTSVGTDMFAISAVSFDPFLNTYLVGVKAEIGAFTLGFEHACYHPMISYQWIPSRSNVVPAFEGAMDRLYLRIRLGGRK